MWEVSHYPLRNTYIPKPLALPDRLISLIAVKHCASVCTFIPSLHKIFRFLIVRSNLLCNWTCPAFSPSPLFFSNFLKQRVVNHITLNIPCAPFSWDHHIFGAHSLYFLSRLFNYENLVYIALLVHQSDDPAHHNFSGKSTWLSFPLHVMPLPSSALVTGASFNRFSLPSISLYFCTIIFSIRVPDPCSLFHNLKFHQFVPLPHSWALLPWPDPEAFLCCCSFCGFCTLSFCQDFHPIQQLETRQLRSCLWSPGMV